MGNAEGVQLAGLREVCRLRDERSGLLLAARRGSDDALVALRVLPRSLARDTVALERVRRNVGTLAGRATPGVVEPLALHQDGDAVAIASEFRDGVRLDELLQQGPLEPAAAAFLFASLLGALGGLHRLEVLHLDVRPGTVLIDPGGGVWLTDPGVAMPLFKRGTAPGTPGYLAPELWNEEEPTAASDVYAAGATAFEAATGSPPFPDGRLQAQRAAHLRRRLPTDGLPAALAEAVGAAMAKSRQDRPEAGLCRARLCRAARSLGAWEEDGRAALAALVAQAPGFLVSARIAGTGPPSTVTRDRAHYRRPMPGVRAGLALLLVGVCSLLAGSAWRLAGHSATAAVPSGVTATSDKTISDRAGAAAALPGVPAAAGPAAPPVPTLPPPSPLPLYTGPAGYLPVNATPAPTPSPSSPPTATPTPTATPSATPAPSATPTPLLPTPPVSPTP